MAERAVRNAFLESTSTLQSLVGAIQNFLGVLWTIAGALWAFFGVLQSSVRAL